ncbi:MAG: D-alanyl-D-alanine dipeptidase [Clostridiales bacterium]|jgi:D-alanyl-D-alanine dipeptidase|nr:D-alanyl-D-alanine dipeptidase [Clostridiales bacterium]
MKVRKLLIAIITLNLIIILIIGVGGFRYLMREGEAQIIAVDINYKTEIIELKQDDFVFINKYIPDVEVELRYATNNNVTKKVLYENANAFLRKGTADKLREANYEFKKLGYRIKIWDAYRPTNVQKILWSKVSDNRFIANPKGGSIHNRGAAVDITLVDKNGKEISMPTDFDGFTKLADKDYSDVDKEKVKNAKLLESIMIKCGFESIYTEWWHFDDKDWKNYGVVDKVIDDTINEAYGNTQTGSSSIIGEVSINSEPDFIEKLRAGINSVNFEKLKIEFDYEIAKLKDIFRGYKTNE